MKVAAKLDNDVYLLASPLPISKNMNLNLVLTLALGLGRLSVIFTTTATATIHIAPCHDFNQISTYAVPVTYP